MTTLEIILILIIWICYGIFNSYQHQWFIYDFDNEASSNVGVILTIVFAPVALIIRIIRGVFFWKGNY